MEFVLVYDDLLGCRGGGDLLLGNLLLQGLFVELCVGGGRLGCGAGRLELDLGGDALAGGDGHRGLRRYGACRLDERGLQVARRSNRQRFRAGGRHLGLDVGRHL